MKKNERLAKLRAKPVNTAAQPHGSKRGRQGKTAAAAPVEKVESVEDSACIVAEPSATSETHTEIAPPTAAPQKGVRPMAEVTFNFKGLNKRKNQAIYEGVASDGQRAKGTLRFYIPKGEGFYPKSIGPITDEFPLRSKSRTEMTPEERKAARKARVPLTLAQKAQKAQERADRLRQQAEAQATPESAAAM